ncbi:twin-arginine translocase subunit TatE [Escherichia coli]|nr:twin-arginine translocase subunit TatE [Escherichia coli]
MGEISITKLLVVAALVVLLFGTKKLRTLGGDLGAAIKGFKKAMNDDDAAAKKKAQTLIFRLKSSLIKSDVASRTPLNILFDTKPASKAGFIRQM